MSLVAFSGIPIAMFFLFQRKMKMKIKPLESQTTDTQTNN